jgi:hypothetical protein
MSDPVFPEIDDEATSELYNEAIEAWCNQFHPTSDQDEGDQVTMYEIIEALNSFYGLSNGFSGTTVFKTLRERGYKSIYDAASNQFKILVSQ